MSRLPPLEYPPRSLRPLHQAPRRYRLNVSDIARLLAIVSTMVLALTFVGMASASTISIIPFGETEDGNQAAGLAGSSDFDNPFNSRGITTRVQQVWHVDFFGSSEIDLTGIAFRFDADQTSGPPTVDLTNLTVQIGTTSLAPSAVTANFAANAAGASLQTVFNGPATISGSRDPAATLNGTPNPFDIVVMFDTGAFSYDPADGNLFVEISGTGGSASSFAPLDSGDLTDLPVSSEGVRIAMAAGFGSTALTGNPADPKALAVAFLADSGTSGGGGPGLSAVPVPPSLALLMSGVGLWGVMAARRRRSTG